MDTSLTWLVRDSQGRLHRRIVTDHLLLQALTAFALPLGDDARLDARLLHHPAVAVHAPLAQGLVFVDVPARRVLNASRSWRLDRVPFVPEQNDALLTLLDAFDAAHRVRTLRFNARHQRPEAMVPGFDPFVRPTTVPDPSRAVPGVSRWDDLAVTLESTLPGARIGTDPAFGTTPVAVVDVPVPDAGLIALAPLLTLIRRGDAPVADTSTTRWQTGLDPEAWDLFNPVLLLDLSPWQVEDLSPRTQDSDDVWTDRLWRRLSQAGVAFSAADEQAWTHALASVD